MTLPCSEESISASSFMLRLDQALEVEHHPRAALRIDQRPDLLGADRRGHGGVHLAGVASATRACTSPVLGLKMSPKRPEVPATEAPSMKWVMSRMGGDLDPRADGNPPHDRLRVAARFRARRSPLQFRHPDRADLPAGPPCRWWGVGAMSRTRREAARRRRRVGRCSTSGLNRAGLRLPGPAQRILRPMTVASPAQTLSRAQPATTSSMC